MEYIHKKKAEKARTSSWLTRPRPEGTRLRRPGSDERRGRHRRRRSSCSHMRRRMLLLPPARSKEKSLSYLQEPPAAYTSLANPCYCFFTLENTLMSVIKTR